MRRSLHTTLGILALILCFPLGAAPEVPDLSTGIRLVKDGDLENGLLELDGVARALAADVLRSRDLALAHVYMGVAYLGLGQEALARTKFRQAIRAQTDLTLSSDEFSARTIRVFNVAREAEISGAALQKEARKSRSKGGLILLGLGGAAAAGLGAVALTRERANAPPAASIAISPEGQAIADVTALAFTASGSDPDGDAVSFSWDFGDGTRAMGASVTHVYSRTGDQRAQLTAGDGLASTVVSATVTVRSLTGSWRSTNRPFLGVGEFRIDGQGTQPRLTVLFPGAVAVPGPGSSSLLTHPRNVVLLYDDPYGGGFAGAASCRFNLTGQADADLQTVTGLLSCTHRGGDASCRDTRTISPAGDKGCAGQQQPITLTRQ